MKEIPGVYYDGRTSKRRLVRLSLSPRNTLIITGLDPHLEIDIRDVRFSERVGNVPRSLYLPGGAKCEVADNDAIDQALRQRRLYGTRRLIHRLETLWPVAIGALIAAIVTTWAVIEFGIPKLADVAAQAIPPSLDRQIGTGGLDLLDATLFSPSELNAAEKERLRGIFAEIIAAVRGPHNFRLEFRRGGAAGPNAFALPSGIVVITDEMVALAQHDNELIAVFAHEIGHVVERHALRMLLQSSATTILIVGLLGDFSAATGLTAAIPTVLVQTAHSREFELEADEFAHDYLRDSGIPDRHFSDLLLRLRDAVGDDAAYSYFSSHPPVERRLRD